MGEILDCRKALGFADLTSTPQTYYSDTDLLLTGEGGDFAGGDIRLAVHLMNLTIPSL